MLLRLILTHDETILRYFTTQCNVNVVKYSLFNRTVVGNWSTCFSRYYK